MNSLGISDELKQKLQDVMVDRHKLTLGKTLGEGIALFASLFFSAHWVSFISGMVPVSLKGNKKQKCEKAIWTHLKCLVSSQYTYSSYLLEKRGPMTSLQLSKVVSIYMPFFCSTVLQQFIISLAALSELMYVQLLLLLNKPFCQCCICNGIQDVFVF